MNVAVVTDSTSDLQPDRVAALNVEVVPLYVHFRGQVLKDHVEVTTSEIFQGVKEGAAIPTTSQPTPADFEAAYERVLARADHVLSVHLSSKLSGTLQSATIAAQQFKGRVTAYDSKSASGGLAMMVERAVRRFREGRSLDEVIAEFDRVRAVHDIRFGVGTLEYLRRNGRIGGAQALIGGLLNIKPILRLADGRVEPAGRARGAQRALQEVVDAMREYRDRFGRVRAAYLYTDVPETVAALRAAGAELGYEEFGMHQVGAVIASHAGPGTYGACLEPIEI